MFKKNNQKKLPISSDSPIRTYTYYAYTIAMLHNEFRTGDLAADIDVVNYNNDEWECVSDDLSLDIKGENLQFRSGKYNKNMNACLCRDAKENDEIRIKINYQQYSQPWSSINILLQKEENSCAEESPYICKIGNFCKRGIYYRVNGKDIKIQKPVLSEQTELILRKNENQIQVFTVNSNQELILLHSENIDGIENSKLQIAVQILLNDNNFYHWLFSNFIQIDCDMNDDEMKIKYFYGLRKNWNYNTFNFYLDYKELEWDDISKKLSDRLDYIKKCIDKDYYVELWINQYYIKSRDEYNNNHFFHQNLVYGYDDSKKELLLLGFNSEGYLELTTISYSNFVRYHNFTKLFNKIYLIKYNQDGNIYYFDIQYVREMIRQYLEGTNSSMYLQPLMQMEHRTYGIHIYDEWLNEEWIPHFISDKRILHLFHEHKVCMKERMDFLFYDHYIGQETYDLLLPKIERIVLLAASLKYIALNCSINNKQMNKEKFYGILLELKEIENICYNALLIALDEK